MICVSLLIFLLLEVIISDHILFYVYADYFIPVDFCLNTQDSNVFLTYKKNGDEILEYRCDNNKCTDCFEKKFYRKSVITRSSSLNIFDLLIGEYMKQYSLRYEDTSSYQARDIKKDEIAKLRFNTLGDCRNYRTTNINYVKYNDIPAKTCFQYGDQFFKCQCKSLYPVCKKYDDIVCSEGGVPVDSFKVCNSENVVFVCGPRTLPGKSGVIARLFRQFYLDDRNEVTFFTHEMEPYNIRSRISDETISIEKCKGETCQRAVSSLKYRIGLPESPFQYYPGEWPSRGWLVVKSKKPENLYPNDIATLQTDSSGNAVGVEYVKKFHLLASGDMCEDGARCKCFSNELNCAFFENSNCTGSLDVSRGFNGKIEFENDQVKSIFHICDNFVLTTHMETLNQILYGVLSGFTVFVLLLIFFICCIYACCRIGKSNTLRKYDPSSLLGRNKFSDSEVLNGIDEVFRSKRENKEQKEKFFGKEADNKKNTKKKKKKRSNRRKNSKNRKRRRKKKKRKREVETSSSGSTTSTSTTTTNIGEDEEEGEEGVTSSEDEFDEDVENLNASFSSSTIEGLNIEFSSDDESSVKPEGKEEEKTGHS